MKDQEVERHKYKKIVGYLDYWKKGRSIMAKMC
jgi:hypothetical protein